jgi:uncharacterized membrane protein YedE/YeeE
MTLDWASFTPGAALIGGFVIGIAASMLVLLNGRIAGIAGIIGGLLRPTTGEVGWRLAFVAGLVAAPILYSIAVTLPTISVDASYPTIVFAGFLVGIGTRYGSGCTSGHGVCGISRLSMRSIVATSAFMITGFATVYIVRHVIGA